MKKSRIKEIIREELENNEKVISLISKIIIDKTLELEEGESSYSIADYIIKDLEKKNYKIIGPFSKESPGFSLDEEEEGSIQLKKDTPDQDIKKFTDKGFDVELKEVGYEPYKGGGGPSKEQRFKNDMSLQQKLLKLKNIRSKYTDDNVFKDIAEPLKLLKIVRPDDKEINVGYDRWGYTCDDIDIDNLGQDETIDLIDGWYQGYTHGNSDNLKEDDKFHITARNLIQTKKDLQQLAKAYEKAEPGEKGAIEKQIRKKYKIKKELEQFKGQLDEARNEN